MSLSRRRLVSIGAASVCLFTRANGAFRFFFREFHDQHIPPDILVVQTSGFNKEGVGGARYRRTKLRGDTNYRAQSADGSWWQLDEKYPDFSMFGAEGGKRDDTLAIQSGLDFRRETNGGYLIFNELHIVSPVGNDESIFKVYSATRLAGRGLNCGVRVSENAGNYAAVFSDAEHASPGVGIGVENVLIHQAAGKNRNYFVIVGKKRNTLAAIWFGGRNVAIEAVIVKEAPGVNTVIVSGKAMSGASITKCRVEFAPGRSAADGYDNSAFYCDGDSWTLADNVCVNLGKLGEARTAYEGHGKNYRIMRNSSVNYGKLANIVGDTHPSQKTTNLLIEENVGHGCFSGIMLWPITGSQLNGVLLRKNIVYRRPADYPRQINYYTGFGAYYSTLGDADGDMSVLSEGNLDVCAPYLDQSPSNVSAAFHWETRGNISLTSIRDRSVGAPNAAFFVDAHQGKADIEIEGTTIEGYCSNSLFNRGAFILKGTCEGRIFGVTFKNGAHPQQCGPLISQDLGFGSKLQVE